MARRFAQVRRLRRLGVQGATHLQVQACGGQFSVTSGTIFANRKMDLRDILGAIAIFVNGAKDHSALQLSRDLDCQHNTVFVLSHKIREALAAEQAKAEINGEVAVDGAYFSGYVEASNKVENCRDRRLAINQNGKRRVVIVARELNGATVTSVAKTEGEGVPFRHGASGEGLDCPGRRGEP